MYKYRKIQTELIVHKPRNALTPRVPRAMDNIIAKTDT